MSSRCRCNLVSQGVPLPRTAAHDGSCRHDMLWFLLRVAPVLQHLRIQKLPRGWAYVDPRGVTAGLRLTFPRERLIPIPVLRGKVRGTRTVLE